MTRILYWNINNFSKWKILDERSDPQFNDSVDRANHIIQQVMAQQVPDIFVVVEVYSRVREVGAEGTVLSAGGNSGFGVLLLLDEIRGAFGNHWCLVPPLNLGGGGQREAVAVFYNSNTLRFAGPYVWYLGNALGVGRAQPAAAATAAGVTDYPTDWRDGMPNPNNPIGALQQARNSDVPYLGDGGGTVQVPEYRCAGQWEYHNGAPPVPSPFAPPFANNRIFFPGQDNRSPFHTRFVDLANGNRIIKLFAVHTSPSTAVAAVNNIGAVAEISGGINAGEVSVVVGDFNVDTFDMNVNGAYTGLDANYVMALNPRNGNVVAPNRQPYCMTHLLPTAHATPFNTVGGYGPDPMHNVYPRYGYMGSMGGQNFQTPVSTGAIDNIFTRYGGGGAVGPATNITVVNTVIGTPYAGIAPAPAGVTAELTGGLAYAQTLTNAIPQPNMAAPAGGINPPVDTIFFQTWPNFGRIHSVSDHLALVIDV